ncbi:hypothetical protein GCM10023074_55400 [Microbispora amethystogenes]|uniref:M23ase beta-sheet core domain-containing protein n=2 Tax=Microbispora amethystogenes TaxID=1427754 RepID=A0ABQ4FKD9_9ACTN|nr:hypothetical protein Mam01_54390 [Microbispora amethystogenes]
MHLSLSLRSRQPKTSHPLRRKAMTGAAITVLAGTLMSLAAQPVSAAAPARRGALAAGPALQLPFPCGQQWRLDTWGHAPALDMVKEPDQQGTDGATLIAPAAGTVNKSYYHQNAGNVIQINHGGGWFTTYLHLQSRAVNVGAKVEMGTFIGRVGHTGPTSNDVPHVHFELGYDADGNGEASWGYEGAERVRPTFNGVTYGTANSQTYRNVTSHNCGGANLGVLDFYLSDDQGSTVATRPVFAYGNSPMVPITGDWDGDGKDTVSTYDPTTGRFFISNDPATGQAQYTFMYGDPNAVPLVGDWDGDGKDNIGVRMGNKFYMRTSPVTTATETTRSVAYGDTGNLPVIGDWDGDGKDSQGIAR